MFQDFHSAVAEHSILIAVGTVWIAGLVIFLTAAIGSTLLSKKLPGLYPTGTLVCLWPVGALAFACMLPAIIALGVLYVGQKTLPPLISHLATISVATANTLSLRHKKRKPLTHRREMTGSL